MLAYMELFPCNLEPLVLDEERMRPAGDFPLLESMFWSVLLYFDTTGLIT